MDLRFDEWMTRGLDLAATPLPVERRDEYATLIESTTALLAEGAPWRALPGVIRDVFGGRGWAWNGIYHRHRDDQLVLVAAAGPPVCATLDLSGGVGSSGMCFDALLMNQTLIASDVKRWPGYVSCDPESGLATVAGMVCPLRDGSRRPVAVWDLDSTEPLAAEDAGFFDHFFATLSIITPFVP